MTPLQSFKALMQEGQRFLFTRDGGDIRIRDNLGNLTVIPGKVGPIERAVKVRKAGSVGLESVANRASISWLDWPKGNEIRHLGKHRYSVEGFGCVLFYDFGPFLPSLGAEAQEVRS